MTSILKPAVTKKTPWYNAVKLVSTQKAKSVVVAACLTLLGITKIYLFQKNAQNAKIWRWKMQKSKPTPITSSQHTMILALMSTSNSKGTFCFKDIVAEDNFNTTVC